ncbi:transcriptional regulator Myc-1-like [Tubulanus polymorphus]|uniref:transcriptional regulator Myc-1-like n=1 Tax=Tubulanus polymorphus TaxID=672921 RepID=UPI003DA29C38
MFVKVLNASNLRSNCTVKMKPKFQTASKIKTEDFDIVQPFFFEDDMDDDFYSTTVPLPSEDIWKKFELIPTPPRSPTRDEQDCVDGYPSIASRSTIQKLNLVSEILDDPISQTQVFSDFFLQNAVANSPSNSLRSNLIQDCMWSGKHQTGDDDTDGIVNCEPEEDVKNEAVKAPSADITPNTACVDPTTVFPYPVSTETKREKRKIMKIDRVITDDSDEEAEEEEIDVVSVPVPVKRPIQVILTSQSKPKGQSVIKPIPQLAFARSDTSPIPHPIDMHSYSLKRKAVSMPSSPQPHSKRLRHELTVDLRKAVQKLRVHPVNSSSDSEEPHKRAQHNVLERQRRTDLKMSFFTLRDLLPDLHKNERAPKVVILQRAAEYVQSLTRMHKRLQSELQQEENRKRRLIQRLEELDRTF